MLKCAAYGLLPVAWEPLRSQVVAADEGGAVLSTGNLADITKHAGNLSRSATAPHNPKMLKTLKPNPPEP